MHGVGMKHSRRTSDADVRLERTLCKCSLFFPKLMSLLTNKTGTAEATDCPLTNEPLKVIVVQPDCTEEDSDSPTYSFQSPSYSETFSNSRTELRSPAAVSEASSILSPTPKHYSPISPTYSLPTYPTADDDHFPYPNCWCCTKRDEYSQYSSVSTFSVLNIRYSMHC